MSLALYLCSLLLFDAITTAVAGPRPAAPRSSSLSSLVPSCALPCLDSFILSSFPASACADPSDLDCLCTSSSASGFTLGEGAIRCSVSACPGLASSALVQAYEICSTVPGAQPMTHATLTASMAEPTTFELDPNSFGAGSPSTPLASSTFSTVSAAPSLGFPTSTINTSNTAILVAPSKSLPVPSASNLPSSTSAAVAQAAMTAASGPILTNAQIAGVVVSGAAAVAVAFILLFCVFCVRKSRRRNSASSFGESAVSQRTPVPPQLPTVVISSTSGNGPSPMPPKAQRVLGVPMPGQNRWSLERKDVRPEDIGVAYTPAVRPNYVQDASPVSIASNGTTSRLLPEKPAYQPYNALFNLPPTGPARPARPARPLETGRVLRPPVTFTPGSPLRVANGTPSPHQGSRQLDPLDTSQAAMQFNPRAMTTLSDPFFTPPRAQMYAMERDSPRARPPRLLVPGKAPLLNNSWSRTPTPQQQQQQPEKWTPPPTFTLTTPPMARTPPGKANVASPSTLSPPAATKPLPLKPRPRPRPVTHLTSGSDTSFEDDDGQASLSDFPIVPNLSPVIESPTRKAPQSQYGPLSAIRYPAVPGKAASPLRAPIPSPTPPMPATIRPVRKTVSGRDRVLLEPIQTSELPRTYRSGPAPGYYIPPRQPAPVRYELAAGEEVADREFGRSELEGWSPSPLSPDERMRQTARWQTQLGPMGDKRRGG